jgi:hypothetical protein
VADKPLPDSFTSYTDTTGLFAFKVPVRGVYNVEAVQYSSGFRALIQNVQVSSDANTVPVGILQKPGKIIVNLPEYADPVQGYVFIPGTLHAAFLNGSGVHAVLDSVPAGTIQDVSYSALNSAIAKIIRFNVRVPSGDSVVIANPDWQYAERLFLNTTPSGANVPGNVPHFPVLIRLTNNNFDFSQTEPGGADIRFAKQDNAPLSYEIERWNSAGGLAEIWVKVDTVYGNVNTQFITMYWGASAGTASNSAAVFDTASGFQGVWHLGQSAKDATINHYDGTLSDTVPVPSPGIIGTAYQFDGVSNAIMMNGTANSTMNFPQDGHYTLSAWVYADTLDYSVQADTSYKNDMTIVSKDNCQYALKTTLTNWQFFEFRANAGWEYSNAPAVKRSWKYVAGVRDGTRQYVYVDGICIVDSVSNLQLLLSPRSTAADLAIGKMPGKRHPTDLFDANTNFFHGIIDEVRISSVPLTPDWIKLCFMNQKADDALVVFP